MTSSIRNIWLVHVLLHTKDHDFSSDSSYMRSLPQFSFRSVIVSLRTAPVWTVFNERTWTHPMWLVRNEISSSRRTCVDSCTLLLNFCRRQSKKRDKSSLEPSIRLNNNKNEISKASDIPRCSMHLLNGENLSGKERLKKDRLTMSAATSHFRGDANSKHIKNGFELHDLA